MNYGSREAKFTATKTGDVVITFPENLYLIGNFGGEAFAANSTAALTNEGDGIYTAEAVEFTANPEDAAKSFFQFCTASGADADDWPNVGTRYMAQKPDQLVESEQEYTILPASEFPNSWYVVPGKYDVLVNLDQMTIMLTFTYDTENLGSIKVTGTDASGVENIAVDADTEAEAEYYNLHGVRVDNPRGGIFIRRTGTTAVKVAL